MSWFHFIRRSDNLGIGTGNLAFAQFQTLPPGGSYLGPQWNIRRSMAPIGAPGFMMLNGATVPNTLRGNGLGIPGQWALAPLAQDKQSK